MDDGRTDFKDGLRGKRYSAVAVLLGGPNRGGLDDSTSSEILASQSHASDDTFRRQSQHALESRTTGR